MCPVLIVNVILNYNPTKLRNLGLNKYIHISLSENTESIIFRVSGDISEMAENIFETNNNDQKIVLLAVYLPLKIA